MSRWPATKAKLVYKVLLRTGWTFKRQSGGSHRILERAGWQDYTFSYHDSEEIGPKALAKLAKRTGLGPDDL